MNNFETKNGVKYRLICTCKNLENISSDSYENNIIIDISDDLIDTCREFIVECSPIIKKDIKKQIEKFPKDKEKALTAYFKTLKGYEKIQSLHDWAYLEVSQLAKKNGWKSIDEYIEKRVYPFYYALTKLEKEEIKKSDYIELEIEALKNMERISNSLAKGECSAFSIGLDEGYALKQIFDALSDNDQKKSIAYFKKLRKCWKEEYYSNCIGWIIYQMAFPDDYRKETFQGSGFQKPILFKIAEIYKHLKDKKYEISEERIRQICRAMHIDIDRTKTGRPKKNI